MPASISKVKTAKNKVHLKRILNDKKKTIRLFLLGGGVLLLIAGFILSTPPAKLSDSVGRNNQLANSNEVVSFLQEPVKIDKSLLVTPRPKERKPNPPVRIVIPALDIDLAVKEAKIIKGYWEVFPDTAGFGLGSAYPDEVGNQVIFAHAREGLFLPLKTAEIGQNIYVFTKDSWYGYKIEAIKEVLPSQTEVIAPTKETILTLYTCSGFADSKRLIITAKKV